MKPVQMAFGLHLVTSLILDLNSFYQEPVCAAWDSIYDDICNVDIIVRKLGNDMMLQNIQCQCFN